MNDDQWMKQELFLLNKRRENFEKEKVNAVKRSYSRFKGYKLKIIWRVIVITVIILLSYYIARIYLEDVNEKLEIRNDLKHIDSIENYYYSGNYERVIRDLYNYNTESKEYDKYWEFAYIYDLYVRYKTYVDAGENNETLHNDISEKINEIKFEENRKLFDILMAQVE